MLSKNTEKQISLLPIYKEKDSIISLLKSQKSNIIIIMGETGSGKTTQVPKIIYKNLPLNNKIICITQPRRVAAISISMRVSEELNSPIGNLVGYSVRFKEKFSQNTKIKYEIAPRRSGDIAECYADPTKAKNELGWEAKKGLEQMCKDAWRFTQHAIK